MLRPTHLSFSESSPAAFKAIRRMDPDEKGPGTVIGDARGYTVSVYFTVATALKDGFITLESYNDLKNAELLSIMKNCKVVQDDSIPNGGGGVSINAAGKTYSEVVKVPLGEPENWIGAQKLRSCSSQERSSAKTNLRSSLTLYLPWICKPPNPSPR